MNPSLLALLILLAAAILAFWLLRPGRGTFWRWRRLRQTTARVLREDVLKHLHRCERYGRPASVESVAGAVQVDADQAAALLTQLEARGLVRHGGQGPRLTAPGREYALHIIRAHRLWERYLAEETGVAQEQWHEQADQVEHRLTPAQADALAAELGQPTHDPHGDPIPTAGGELVAHGGRPLTTMPLDQPLRIVHLEDEPEATYAQLVAEGLYPGQEVRLLELAPQRVRFWAGGDEHLLAPVVAANISAVPLTRAEDGDAFTLDDLRPGQTAAVKTISPSCRGRERRRFLDLGILPATPIAAVMASPSGDPTAYRIRGALIALRREQAALIQIDDPRDED